MTLACQDQLSCHPIPNSSGLLGCGRVTRQGSASVLRVTFSNRKHASPKFNSHSTVWVKSNENAFWHTGCFWPSSNQVASTWCPGTQSCHRSSLPFCRSLALLSSHKSPRDVAWQLWQILSEPLGFPSRQLTPSWAYFGGIPQSANTNIDVQFYPTAFKAFSL